MNEMNALTPTNNNLVVFFKRNYFRLPQGGVFRENCKSKLKSVGITKKQEQAFFIEWVFGTHPNSVLEAEDRKDLKSKLTVLKDELEEEERRITGNEQHFWTYLSVNEKMMKDSMIAKSRRKAGMPSDSNGKPLRCYTNMAGSVNNKLTRQKEAVTRKEKSKDNLTKLEFVKEVWEEIDRQQQLELSKVGVRRQEAGMEMLNRT